MTGGAVELILIRHAAAEGQGRYLGRRSNPSLSAAGRAQAEALGAGLATAADNPWKMQASPLIAASPMARALQTAEIISPGCERLVIDDFAEFDFGEWDGMSWREISSVSDKLYRSWLDSPAEFSPPGGESLNTFSLRVEHGFKRLKAEVVQAGKDRVCLVAHGGVIRSLLCSLLRLPADRHWSFRVDCASVSCVKLYSSDASEQTAVLEYMNRRF